MSILIRIKNLARHLAHFYSLLTISFILLVGAAFATAQPLVEEEDALSASQTPPNGPSIDRETDEPVSTELYNAIYQIVVIETETNNKAALGSGFQISSDGLVITNYHVISNMVFEPDHHRVEFVAHDGEEGTLTLLSFDVINDLAILRRENAPADHLPLATQLPARGESIYAIGNPHDVGMLMVTGAYNGLAEHSYVDQILYSGSLNSGMSGGPTVNGAGEVVGVNVSTAGSQLSFLVPVSKVFNLLPAADTSLKTDEYLGHIRTQIKAHQDEYFTILLDADWKLETLGDHAEVPGEMGLDTNCWGNSNEDNEEALYLVLQLQCNNSNRIYLQPRFNTGALHYSYFYNQAKDSSDYRFHKAISNSRYFPDNAANDDEVTPFECEQTYLEADPDAPEGYYLQVGFCNRAYINLEGLYDIVFYRTSGGPDRTLTTHFTLAGVDQAVALEFTQRFMDEVQWKSL